jgi:formiminoglutamase
MELALRGYVTEPNSINPTNWPAPLDPAPAVAPTLRSVLEAALKFAISGESA